MVLLMFIIIINIVFAYYFLYKVKKNLHVLEVFAYWCFAGILIQNYSAILYLDFQKIILSEMASHNWADVANRCVLMPLLVVYFLNHYVVSVKISKKVFLIMIFTVILCGIEWGSDWAGILQHKDWKLWWSPASKFLILGLAILFMKWFRSYFFRKDNHR